ncbi:MAG TPA: RNase adapter RapZ [Gammaproteobacteria bacterium]|nr:RNase adapter RapZ [Gammaproteobacteria bacterium]
MKLIIVSGLSGSGKSIALDTLEDLGYYCIDNLPIQLLPTFIQQLTSEHLALPNTIAVSIDARNLKNNSEAFFESRKLLTKSQIAVEVIYLETEESTLLRRFSETRRRHPLSNDAVSLTEALTKERQLLAPIAGEADLCIDTTKLHVHQLRQLIKQRLTEGQAQQMSLLFESFGFKHGIPQDADFIFDVRCLPNPYWEPQLRAFDGQSKEIADYLLQHKEVQKMIQDIHHFIHQWLKDFEKNNRSYLTVAIGCTGGRHRSVYIADQLAQQFNQEGVSTLVRHRELK